MQNKQITIGLTSVLLIVIVAGAAYVINQHNTVKSLSGKINAPQQQLQQTPSTATDTKNPGQPAQVSGQTNMAAPETQNSSVHQVPTAPSTASITPTQKTTVPTPIGVKARDAKREADMRQLLEAQNMWYRSNNHYYTCSIIGGDCKGKINNYPVSIGSFVKNVIDPLNSGVGCGKDYTYCALDNTVETNKFCYYAKLEGGGYYTASHAGNFTRATAPLTFDECAGAFPNGNSTPVATAPTTAQARDALRQSDMRQLMSVQEMWYGDNNRYYTCGPSGGDCRSTARNYPAAIGIYMPAMPIDPVNSGSGCGRDLVYCGLDNTATNQKFCFFTKLESGGYYTASQAGNFKRSTPPATLTDCALPN
jgi:hypothetical protein